MALYDIKNLETTRELVSAAQSTDEPIIIEDGEDECLVAMRPAVFEHLLFDGLALNAEQRDKLHF